MKNLKKFGIFFVLCFYVVGTIGGIGVSIYQKSYFIAICVAVLSTLAFPTVKKLFKQMLYA